MGHRAGAAVLFVVLVAVSATAATLLYEETRADAGPVPVAAGSTKPEGTALPDGFTVAPGAVAVGDVFPFGALVAVAGKPVEDDGWRAYLVVTGDPIAVVDHYRREAREMGVALQPLRACGIHPAAIAISDDPMRGTLLCEASGGDGKHIDVRVRVLRGAEPRPASWATVEVNKSRLTGRDPGAAPPVVVEDAAPVLSSSWPPLPRAGDTFAFGTRPDVLKIEAGSRAAAHVFDDLRCFALVLVLDDDAETVAERYRDQFRGKLVELPAPPLSKRHDDGFTIWQTGVDFPGGGGYQIEVFEERRTHKRWGIVSGCND
jgi:hypothetical protein